MVSRAGRRSREAGPGFTLIELLLTTVLVLLLAGAIVFNFTTLQHGRELEEGAAQVEALVRFVRAQAAQSGCPVQLNFEEELTEGWTLSLGGIRVLRETDPVGDPGTWTELPEAARFVQAIMDLVEVQQVRWLDDGLTEAAAAEELPGEGAGERGELGENLPDVFPPVTFYPDGSSDSAEIVLCSRDADDARRVAVRILGLTGTVRREFLVEHEGEDLEPDDETAEPTRPGTESPTPVKPRASGADDADALPGSK